MKENSDKTVHPWGNEKGDPISTESSAVNLEFEDSFTSHTSNSTSLTPLPSQTQPDCNQYVPLDDSKQYLESLEKKLAKVQGKTKHCQESERKQLIKALALSREDHTSNYLKSEESNFDIQEGETSSTSLGSVDPQGTLGTVIRKVAPDKVAMSAEELAELLKGDILAKVHDSLHYEEADPDPPSKQDNGETLIASPENLQESSNTKSVTENSENKQIER